MTTLVRRGTARRLGLRPWDSSYHIPVGRFQMPDGTGRLLVSGGSRARVFFVDDHGSAVHNVPITLDIGAGAVATRWGTVRTKATRIGPKHAALPGHTEEVQPVNTNDVRDWMAQADPTNAGLIMSRDQVVNEWCREHGKDKDGLTFADIAAIRALPQWINAG